MRNQSFLFVVFFCFSFSLLAQAPSGYYDAADGKSGAQLKTCMSQIIHNYVSADYDGFTAVYWGNVYYKNTDWNSGGYFWDMYSNEQRTTYNSSLMSREHCLPRSWWEVGGDYGTANSDLHNLYPSDYTANSKKSNYPLGQVGTISWTNNVVKLGDNTYSGYSGTVFEPADEYKGDFARTYFYMVTCHEDYANRWTSEATSTMLDNNSYPVFKTWALNMLLEWARQDPVSQKEIDRNNAVYAIQQNRNPFIDFPDLFEYIWGTKTSDVLSVSNKASSATLISPIDGKSIAMGTIKINTQKSRLIPVKTILLSNNLTVEWTENTSGYFSVNSTSVDASKSNTTEGDTLSITYAPLVAGTHSAKLHVYNTETGISSTLTFSGTATNVVTVDPVTPDDDSEVIFFYTGPWTPASLPTYMATNVTAAPYSNGDLKFGTTKNYLTATFDKVPGYMRFAIYPRNAWGTNQNHLYVYEGTSASTLETTPIADFDNTFVTNGDSYNNTPAIPLKETTRAIKIEYIKVAQNAGITNLFVTLKTSSSINQTDGSSVRMVPSKGSFYVDGLSAPQLVTIYNLYGQIVYQGVIENGTHVDFPYQGIFIAKVGNYIQKLVF